MAKNIMLLFISFVNLDNENKVNEAEYEGIGTTYTTNESAVLYVLKSTGNKLDKIFAFASKGVLENFVRAVNVPENTTHFQYFKNRLKDLGLNVEKILTEDTATQKGSVYPYDEQQIPDAMNERTVWKSMGQILEMASRIQNYVKENPNEEIILHVDSTGGLRNAAMMIMAIMRLMQYQNITIGKVLYSNYDKRTGKGTVEEVHEIYHLFDLISGAEEFVRFGSVDVIKNYFKGKQNPEVLQKLLDAMSQFAEAIKISRRSEFQNALESLKTAYKNFSAASIEKVTDIKSLNYNLMQQLESRINQEYAALLQNDADDYISIISWCLDHGYLQQALMLYTECLPYVIVTKKKLITVSDDTLEDVHEKAAKDRMNREWEFYLLNDYKPGSYEEIKTAYKNFITKFRKIIHSQDIETFKANNTLEDWTARGIIKFDYETYINLLEDSKKLKTNHNLAADSDTVKTNLPTLYSFWHLVPENIFEQPENKRVNKILTFYGVKNDAFIKTNDGTLKLHHMIRNEMLKLNIADAETFLKIIERYFTLKVERNDCAHARMIPRENFSSSNSETSYVESLKKYMQDGINEISAACETVKP